MSRYQKEVLGGAYIKTWLIGFLASNLKGAFIQVYLMPKSTARVELVLGAVNFYYATPKPETPKPTDTLNIQMPVNQPDIVSTVNPSL